MPAKYGCTMKICIEEKRIYVIRLPIEWWAEKNMWQWVTIKHTKPQSHAGCTFNAVLSLSLYPPFTRTILLLFRSFLNVHTFTGHNIHQNAIVTAWWSSHGRLIPYEFIAFATHIAHNTLECGPKMGFFDCLNTFLFHTRAYENDIHSICSWVEKKRVEWGVRMLKYDSNDIGWIRKLNSQQSEFGQFLCVQIKLTITWKIIFGCFSSYSNLNQ